MTRIEELERELELLKQILEIQKLITQNEHLRIPSYPVYPIYPSYPDTNPYPYPGYPQVWY